MGAQRGLRAETPGGQRPQEGRRQPPLSLSVLNSGGLSESGATNRVGGNVIQECARSPVSLVPPVNPVNSRRPKPSAWRPSGPASPTLALMCPFCTIRRDSRRVGGSSVGDGRTEPVPSRLWLTQARKVPFLQQNLFLNPCHVMW